MSNRPAGHAFISYVGEDGDRVDALEAFLEAAGVSVWRDKNELWPGDEWKLEISRAIQQGSLAFIACFSERSAAREKTYQFEELTLAAEEFRQRPPGKPWLFPVRFADVPIPYFDLGAGRNLNTLQRADIHGELREPALARLVTAILRVLPESINSSSDESVAQPQTETESEESDTEVTTKNPVGRQVKDLLRSPATEIDLDDLMSGLSENARDQLLDETLFPSTTAESLESVAGLRFLTNRTDTYWEILKPIAEALFFGCAFGNSQQQALWSRTMRTLANTTPMEGGMVTLLELRRYPRLLALYAAGLGALARDNYGSLKAITTDARIRKDGRSVPIISVIHPHYVFANYEAAAQSLPSKDGNFSDSDLEEIVHKRRPRRYTPVSDHLHYRLRDLARPLLPFDEDYTDTFDRLEVFLGLIAEDAKLEFGEKQGVWLPGYWVGSYSWRRQMELSRYPRDIEKELRDEDESWAPLIGGLFGGSVPRAGRAFGGLMSGVQRARQSM